MDNIDLTTSDMNDFNLTNEKLFDTISERDGDGSSKCNSWSFWRYYCINY